jgi:glycosyltransferase involved in cell wall biosynthesis
MNKPLISVIIPAHNGALYLADAIQSAIDQSYPYLEIWVIDNRSIDRTAEIAQSFPQVRYVYSDVASTALARNEGVLQARGSLVAFLDQDDVWTPDKLSKQFDFLQKHPAAAAVVCEQRMVMQPGHPKPHWLKKEFLEAPQPAYLPSALLIHKSLLEQTNSFDSTFSLASDVAWFFQAKHRGIEVALLPETLLIRRIHNDNTSHRYIELQKEILSVIHSSLQERRTKISVIIPVWNGEKYLAESIESALSQDYPNKEILVVNDGSTDGTQAIIDRFGTKVRSLFQPNRGLGAARNLGIRASTGAYLAFLDHDDIWTKSKLRMQMDQMDASDPLVFSHVKQFLCPSLSEEERSKLVVNQEELPSHFAGNLFISKQRFLQIGFFFEKKTVGEFVDWYLRALDAKVPIVMLPHLCLHRRVHQNNMGRQKELYGRTEYLKILKNSLDRRRSYATSS